MTTEAGVPAQAAAELPDEMTLDEVGDIVRSWENPDQHMKFEGDAPEEVEPPPTRSSKEDAEPEAEPQRTNETEEDEPEAPEEAQVPDIDPPRSWTKEEKELFAQWPREAQEAISRVSAGREKDFLRSQSEAAERQKALDAELAKVEQVRKEYESKVPSLVRSLEDALQSEFGDIKTLQDVTKLQAEDPFRFQQWQIHQMKINAAKVEQEAIDKRNAEQTQSSWAKHVNDESEEFAKSLSEADRGKLKEWNAKAPDFLVDKGFSRDQLNRLANGEKISIYDHRIQSLILDGMKYQAVANAPKAIAQKPVPTVQKPGTHRVASVDAEVNALSKRLSESGSEEDGWALLQAQMKAQSRRSR